MCVCVFLYFPYHLFPHPPPPRYWGPWVKTVYRRAPVFRVNSFKSKRCQGKGECPSYPYLCASRSESEVVLSYQHSVACGGVSWRVIFFNKPFPVCWGVPARRRPSTMSRARSKTVDSAEVKKKGIPRRLNEKIALIKEKEQAQSEAFEQAMRSILEVGVASCGCVCMWVYMCNVLPLSSPPPSSSPFPSLPSFPLFPSLPPPSSLSCSPSLPPSFSPSLLLPPSFLLLFLSDAAS